MPIKNMGPTFTNVLVNKYRLESEHKYISFDLIDDFKINVNFNINYFTNWEFHSISFLFQPNIFS